MKHASHKAQLARLKRAQGQVAGVIRMVEEEKYCLDILSQIRAARAALRKVEKGVLETHAGHCLRNAVESGHPAEIEKKLSELMHAVERFSR
jgi:DNA-binding FrmR family transcriptional regulator